MTPFAGVGVNVAMEDALHLARNIIASKPSWSTETERRSSLAAALSKYETEMFVRAEDYAKQTWMYLGLFFHERGGIAMVEHFERTRAQEAAAAAATVAVAVEGQETPVSQTESESETKTESESETKTEPESETTIESESETTIESESETKTEFDMYTEKKNAELTPSGPISVSVSVEEIPIFQIEKPERNAPGPELGAETETGMGIHISAPIPVKVAEMIPSAE